MEYQKKGSKKILKYKENIIKRSIKTLRENCPDIQSKCGKIRTGKEFRIQSECGKDGPEKTPYLDTFQAVRKEQKM